MSGSGSISAMISSLKSNRNLLRSKKIPNMFSNRSDFSNYYPEPLSHEENYRIIEENKRKLNRETNIKRFFGVVIILLISAIFIYFLML